MMYVFQVRESEWMMIGKRKEGKLVDGGLKTKKKFFGCAVL